MNSMSNYCATARSSYFKVKDLEAFKNWCRSRDIEPIDGDPADEKLGLVAMISATPNEDGWPSFRDNGHDEPVEIDLAAELSAPGGWLGGRADRGRSREMPLRHRLGSSRQLERRNQTHIAGGYLRAGRGNWENTSPRPNINKGFRPA